MHLCCFSVSCSRSYSSNCAHFSCHHASFRYVDFLVYFFIIFCSVVFRSLFPFWDNCIGQRQTDISYKTRDELNNILIEKFKREGGGYEEQVRHRVGTGRGGGGEEIVFDNRMSSRVVRRCSTMPRQNLSYLMDSLRGD